MVWSLWFDWACWLILTSDFVLKLSLRSWTGVGQAYPCPYWGQGHVLSSTFIAILCLDRQGSWYIILEVVEFPHGTCYLVYQYQEYKAIQYFRRVCSSYLSSQIGVTHCFVLPKSLVLLWQLAILNTGNTSWSCIHGVGNQVGTDGFPYRCYTTIWHKSCRTMCRCVKLIGTEFNFIILQLQVLTIW